MNLKVRKIINNTTTLEIEFTDERDLKEALLKATPFMQIPRKCGKCHSDNVTFQARNTKGGEFIYPGMYCFDCKAQRNMGEFKSPKGALFWKQWEDPYVKNNNRNNNPDPEIPPEEYF